MKKTILIAFLLSITSLIAESNSATETNTTKTIFDRNMTKITIEETPIKRTIQERLTDSLNKMGNLKTYSVEATSDNLLIYGKDVKSKYTNVFSMLVDRPYKATIKIKGDTKNREYYFNNGNYTLYNQEDVIYWGDLFVPKNTDDALDFMLEKYGEEQPVSILLYSDMVKRIHPNSITDFGEEVKNGEHTFHIGFRSKDHKKDIHVWISKESDLVVAYSLIRKNEVNEYRINISLKWTLNPEVSDSDFIFSNKIPGQKIPIDIKKTRKQVK